MPAWQIGPTRRAIRVLQGYVELRRSMTLSDSDVVTAQNLLWLMVGMAYGLEQGAAALAASGYKTAEFITRPMAIPTSNYSKAMDLELLRLIENARFTPDRLLPNKRVPVDAPMELIDWVFGPGTAMGVNAARAFGDLVIGSLESDEARKLALNPKRFAWRHDSILTSPPEREAMAPFVELLGLEKIAARIAKFVARDAIRLENREVVTALPSAPKLTQLQERWERSPLMRRAYGHDPPVILRT